MLFPEEPTPIEMFGAEHLIGTSIVILCILAVFFLRKYFIKYKKLDLGFRIFLSCFILIFEVVPWFVSMAKGTVNEEFLLLMPSPLCGHLLWLTIIMLLSNSSRLHKLIYPLCVTGASLSLIFIDSHYSFPAWQAMQFFVTHGAFLCAVLYFFFTKKSVKYTIKDLGNSMLLFSGMGAVMLLIWYFNPNSDYYSNAYFLINPPGGLEEVKELMGQVGYTIFFIFCIAVMQFIVYGVTWLCTRKRKEEDQNLPEFKDNKFMNKVISVKYKTRKYILIIYIILFTYLATIQNAIAGTTGGWVLFAFDLAFFYIGILLASFFEYSYVYEEWKKRQPMLIEEDIK